MNRYKGLIRVHGVTTLEVDPSRGIHFGGQFVAVEVDGIEDAALLPLGAFPTPPEDDSRWDLELETNTGFPWTPNPSITITPA